ncbi:MAG: DUF1080 domain-containing protein [Rikenellaceae bacterium]
MKKIILPILIFAAVGVTAQQTYKLDRATMIHMTEDWEPQPAVVTAGVDANMVAPPSDAIVLFDGEDLAEWQMKDGRAATWDIEDGVMCTVPKSGLIISKREFSDCQLHVEWMIPEGTTGESQGRGNSGVFLAERYEVQVLDNYNSQTYVKGQAGSIYKQHAPLVNACKPQGEWNTYDIIYTAPTFKKDGTLRSYAKLTVLHNGVLVQNNVTVFGATSYTDLPVYDEHGAAPISIQDHNNKVCFRNIWVREL